MNNKLPLEKIMQLNEKEVNDYYLEQNGIDNEKYMRNIKLFSVLGFLTTGTLATIGIEYFIDDNSTGLLRYAVDSAAFIVGGFLGSFIVKKLYSGIIMNKMSDESKDGLRMYYQVKNPEQHD